MNILSGVQGYIQPNGFINLLPKAVENVTQSKAIPHSELQQLSQVNAAGQVIDTAETKGTFGSFLTQAVADINSKQIEAGKTLSGMLSGQNVSLHETMIAMEEAGVAFQLMVEVRNRLLESYQEIMRMQI